MNQHYSYIMNGKRHTPSPLSARTPHVLLTEVNLCCKMYRKILINLKQYTLLQLNCLRSGRCDGSFGKIINTEKCENRMERFSEWFKKLYLKLRNLNILHELYDHANLVF